eukprot:2126913-Alexandrium_andersonii.AAC.1
MSASLVGSEMCIRDSALPESLAERLNIPERIAPLSGIAVLENAKDHPVSYTHLTLPTICSV